jgi:hypothetical protein
MVPSTLNTHPGKRQPSEAEQKLVHMALQIAADTTLDYSALMPERQCRPVPFFGPIERAKVITFGLNPSTGEFTKQRSWSGVTDAALADELVNYWTNSRRPPHKWFQPWETVLSKLGVSYTSDAAHIDLSPRATNCRKGELRSLFVKMLQTDASIWIEALRSAPKCKLILAAGSATNASKSGYINDFIFEKLSDTGVRLRDPWHRKKGAGQTAFHTICLPEGREIPFFFCSTGPSKNGTVLIEACRVSIDTLKKHLNDQPGASNVPPASSESSP